MIEFAFTFLLYYNKNNYTHTKIESYQLNQLWIALCLKKFYKLNSPLPPV